MPPSNIIWIHGEYSRKHLECYLQGRFKLYADARCPIFKGPTQRTCLSLPRTCPLAERLGVLPHSAVFLDRASWDKLTILLGKVSPLGERFRCESSVIQSIRMRTFNWTYRTVLRRSCVSVKRSLRTLQRSKENVPVRIRRHSLSV